MRRCYFTTGDKFKLLLVPFDYIFGENETAKVLECQTWQIEVTHVDFIGLNKVICVKFGKNLLLFILLLLTMMNKIRNIKRSYKLLRLRHRSLLNLTNRLKAFLNRKATLLI